MKSPLNSRGIEGRVGEENYQFAKEVNAFNRPALPIVLDHQGRKITHGTWGINKDIPKDWPAQGINHTAEKTHTFFRNYEHNRCVIPVNRFYDWKHASNRAKDSYMQSIGYTGTMQISSI